MRKKISEICLLITIFFVPIAVFKPAYNYVFIKFVIAQAMVFCVVLLWIYNWLFQCRGQACLSSLPKFPRGYLAAFCIWCLASFFMARNKFAGATELANLFTYVLIYFVVLETCKSRSTFLRICFVWFLATFIAEVPTLLNPECFRDIPIIRNLPQLFGNPTFFAPYIVLCIPVVLSFILYFSMNIIQNSKLKTQNSKLLFPLALCCILVVTSIISLHGLHARAAWIGFCVSIVFFACAFVYLRWGLARGFYLFIGVILLCAAVWQVRSESIMQVINEELLTGTIGIRKWIWLGSMKMFLARPFTGWGIGNFATIYPQFRFPDYFLNPHAVNATRHVHCELLEIGCELGVVGLALFVGIVGAILFRGINTARNTDDRLKKYLLIGFVSGIVGMLFENLGNVDLRFHSSGIFLWFALGCVSTLSGGKTKDVIARSVSDEAISKDKIALLSLAMTKRTFLRIPVILLFSALLLFVFNYFSVNPLRAEVYFRKGVEYRNKKDWNKAISMYEKTIKLNRGYLKAYYRLAFAYAKVGKTEDAFRVYYQLAELDPDYADIHYNLAKLYISIKNYKKAARELEIAVGQNPYNDKALMGLGNVYEKLGKLNGAVQQYKKAVKLSPDFGGAHNNLGNIYMMKKEWGKAIEEYKIALRLMPKALGVARNLGVAYYKKEDYKESKNIFKKILRIQPDNKQACNYLEQINKVMNKQ